MKHLYLPIRNTLLVLATVYTASAQRPSTPTLSFDQLTARAGIIFSGAVQKVDSNDASVTHVTFSVDEGIRGTFSGQTITLNEWKGSMPGGARYRAGEKLLIFFHAPSPNGLTSPVGGSAGVVRFADAETIKLTAEQAAAWKRSARLRGALAASGSEVNGPRMPAADLVRALRLVTESQ